MKRRFTGKVYVVVSLTSDSVQEKTNLSRLIEATATKYEGDWIGQGTWVKGDQSSNPTAVHDIEYDIPPENVDSFIEEVSAINPKLEVGRG